jgi:hypothetical protein
LFDLFVCLGWFGWFVWFVCLFVCFFFFLWMLWFFEIASLFDVFTGYVYSRNKVRGWSQAAQFQAPEQEEPWTH